MKTDWHPLLPLALALCLSSILAAEEKTKNPSVPVSGNSPTWETRVLRLPPGFWWQIPPSHEFGPSGEEQEKAQQAPPPLPPANATREEWREHLKESTAAFRKWLEEYGVDCPEGTVLLHDAESGTLALRTTRACMADVEFLAHEAVQRMPHVLVFSLDVVRTDGETARKWVNDAIGKSSHDAVWQDADARVRQGAATSVAQLRLEARSGQRASAFSGEEAEYLSGLKESSPGHWEPVREEGRKGVLLEIDPVLGPDYRTLDVKVELEWYAPPTRSEKPLPGATSPTPVPGLLADSRPCARLTTALNMYSGMSRLIGTWQVEGRERDVKGEEMRAAFLHAEAVPVMPAANANLAAVLLTHADTSPSSPVPASPPEPAPGNFGDLGLPAGMTFKKIKLPPTFFSVEARFTPQGSAPQGDPFAPAVAPPGLVRCRLPIEILRHHGVPFPEGSSATFRTFTGVLEVINTPANIQKIDELVDGIECNNRPSIVALRLHVVEADGKILRPLLQEARSLTDHSKLWKKVSALAAQGSAAFRATSVLETRSGERSLVENGTEHLVEVPLGEAEKGTPGPSTPATGASPRNFTFKPRLAGLRLELESVIAPDGQTLDVNYSLDRDYASPSTEVMEVRPSQTPSRLVLPSLTFHRASVVSATTLSSGSAKLLGVWKTDGAPGYEGKDMVQAAFLCADIVTMKPVEPQAGSK